MRSKYLSKIRIRSFDKISISILFHSLYSLFTKKESSPIYIYASKHFQNCADQSIPLRLKFFLKIVKAFSGHPPTFISRDGKFKVIVVRRERDLNARVSLSVNGVSIFTPRDEIEGRNWISHWDGESDRSSSLRYWKRKRKEKGKERRKGRRDPALPVPG